MKKVAVAVAELLERAATTITKLRPVAHHLVPMIIQTCVPENRLDDLAWKKCCEGAAAWVYVIGGPNTRWNSRHTLSSTGHLANNESKDFTTSISVAAC